MVAPLVHLIDRSSTRRIGRYLAAAATKSSAISRYSCVSTASAFAGCSKRLTTKLRRCSLTLSRSLRSWSSPGCGDRLRQPFSWQSVPVRSSSETNARLAGITVRAGAPCRQLRSLRRGRNRRKRSISLILQDHVRVCPDPVTPFDGGRASRPRHRRYRLPRSVSSGTVVLFPASFSRSRPHSARLAPRLRRAARR